MKKQVSAWWLVVPTVVAILVTVVLTLKIGNVKTELQTLTKSDSITNHLADSLQGRITVWENWKGTHDQNAESYKALEDSVKTIDLSSVNLINMGFNAERFMNVTPGGSEAMSNESIFGCLTNYFGEVVYRSLRKSFCESAEKWLGIFEEHKTIAKIIKTVCAIPDAEENPNLTAAHKYEKEFSDFFAIHVNFPKEKGLHCSDEWNVFYKDMKAKDPTAYAEDEQLWVDYGKWRSAHTLKTTATTTSATPTSKVKTKGKTKKTAPAVTTVTGNSADAAKVMDKLIKEWNAL